MRLKSLRFLGFKRFTDTTVQGLPTTARLIVLAGPNGSGKSSMFDGLKTWHWANGGAAGGWDESYGAKVGTDAMSWPEHVTVQFHEPLPAGPEDRKKLIYVRSAFRNEADFNIPGINQVASPLDSPRVTRLIDNDASVSDNYQRLILQTLDGVYSNNLPDDMTRIEIRDRVIGKVRTAMTKVFPDLQLDGVGGIFGTTSTIGTFYFSKGSSTAFLYKNLSAGEKASFDLILDAVIKAEYFDNSIWCIDEPETHLNTRIQGALLETLVDLLPSDSQMLLASHSIGFMRKAWEIAKADPGSVAFLDLHGADFDSQATLEPVQTSRAFWASMLDVALGDMARLMAPERIVLCEGRPAKGISDGHGDFDADCYRQIFAQELPETDFLSVGNSADVRDTTLEAGRAIQTIASGTKTIRLVDRDLMNDEEVQKQNDSGIQVLSRRNIEAYLLDDEVLEALCVSLGRPDEVAAAIRIKNDELQKSISRGHDADNLKKAAGAIYVELRKQFSLSGAGSDWHAFAKGILVPLIKPDMIVYSELRDAIFGAAS